ncbi:MAG: hypothetical protein EBX60_10950, partial [Betaproteobacteria bacterium]|nr:hypothetical protein [Betaproteobacteria bacterium]
MHAKRSIPPVHDFMTQNEEAHRNNAALGPIPGSEGENSSLFSDINVTPFVDVMLVLLVIFMVTTPALLPMLKLDLPSGGPAQSLESTQTGGAESLLFELDAKGFMRLNREPLPDDEALAARFAEAAQLRPQPELQLRVDASTAYARISRIFLIAQEQGLTRMSLVMDQGAAAAG